MNGLELYINDLKSRKLLVLLPINGMNCMNCI